MNWTNAEKKLRLSRYQRARIGTTPPNPLTSLISRLVEIKLLAAKLPLAIQANAVAHRGPV
jgi:hypothetical protein